MSKHWIQTYLGGQFWPLKPDAEHVFIEDIARALANQGRFAGHTSRFYSVAEHSAVVSDLCPLEYALQGLLHDASEAYMVDLPRPIKHHWLMWPYRWFESKVQGKIYERFGLDRKIPKIVKRIDNAVLTKEVIELKSPVHPEWGIEDYYSPDGTCDINVDDIRLKGWTPDEAYYAFLDRFNWLNAQRESPFLVAA